jgi:hypothetical protein
MPEKIAKMREMAAAAGRDPKLLTVSIYGCKPDPQSVDDWERSGANRVMFNLPSAEADTVLPLLDKYASLIR